MYSEKVMDHFQHPRNVGEIENASGVGTVGNAKCGDIMRIFLDIDDETHIIRDCKFKTFGCGAAVATSSMATEMVKGKTIEEAMKLTNKAVMEALDGLRFLQTFDLNVMLLCVIPQCSMYSLLCKRCRYSRKCQMRRYYENFPGYR